MTTSYARRRHTAATLDSIRVAEAMHRGVIRCRDDTTIHTAARLLAAHRIHALVVAPGPGGRGRGLVSDIDLVAAAADGAAADATVGQIASTPTVFVRPDDTVARAAQLMRDYKTHHVVVLARDGGRPVGMLSTLDVVDVVAELL